MCVVFFRIATRTAHRIPDEILNDESLQKAIGQVTNSDVALSTFKAQFGFNFWITDQNLQSLKRFLLEQYISTKVQVYYNRKIIKKNILKM